MTEIVQTQDVTQPELVIGAVEADFNQLASVHNSVQFAAECNYAIQQIYKNDYITKIARSNPVSVQNAVRNIAAIGLTLNPALKYAYLVPRKGIICLDVSYMGLMHLAQDTGSVSWAQCKIAYANDKYTSRGVSVEPTHEFSAFGDRGEIIGAYCVVKLPGGDFLTHEMQIEDIFAIRDRSEAWKAGKSGPWATDEKEMIKKTVVKQASKYWPKVERMNEAIKVINDGGEGIDFEAEKKEAIEANPLYKVGQNLVAHMSNDDSESLLDEWEAIDSEDQEKVWKRLGSADRSGIKKLLSEERTNRKEESE